MGFFDDLKKVVGVGPKPVTATSPTPPTAALPPIVGQPPTGPRGPVFTQQAFDLLVELEGLKLAPYLDTKGIPTIGIGCITYEDGRKVTMQDPPITKDRAFALCNFHLDGTKKCIANTVKVPLTDNQYGALCCFIHNIGVGGFSTSTVLKRLNAYDYAGAAEAMMMWLKPPELKGRREKEKAFFLKG